MELTEARRLALDLVSPRGTEWVALEGALGRVLGKTLLAPNPLPREARSRMDGFALRSADTRDASPERPVRLKILSGLLAAGHVSHREPERGECIRILTGARLPAGADAVVPKENVSEQDGDLLLKHRLVPGDWLTLPGDEVGEGELLAPEGALLTPTRLAMIAAFGHAQIPVYRRPQVALLATGDEVREVAAITEGPWTTCNNRHLLAWLVRLQGGSPLSLGIARDDPGTIAERLENEDADLVITTGGAGHGERDFILQVWEATGVQTLFRRINLSPGKNSALGVKVSHRGAYERRQLFFALPGNPWAAQVVFEEMIAPLLRGWQGMNIKEIPLVTATLKGLIKKKKGDYKAVRGKLDMRTLPPSFTPSARKRTTLFTNLRNDLTYALIESQTEEMRWGSNIHIRLPDLPLPALPPLGLE